MKKRHVKRWIALMVILSLEFLLWSAVKQDHDLDRLHLGRREAMTIALTKMKLGWWDVRDLDTRLELEGSGNYPCYYMTFSYRDEAGEWVRVRCAVDGETSEFLGVERVE